MWRVCAEHRQSLSDDYPFRLRRLPGWLLQSQPHDHSLCTPASGSHTCLYTGMCVCQVEPPTENDFMSSPTCPPSLIGFIWLKPLTCDFTNKESRLSFASHFFFGGALNRTRGWLQDLVLHYVFGGVWVRCLHVFVSIMSLKNRRFSLDSSVWVQKFHHFWHLLVSPSLDIVKIWSFCHLELKVRRVQCSQLYCSSFRKLKTPLWDITQGFHTMLMLEINCSIGLAWIRELTTIIHDFM